jgi:hypothetical protein
MPDPLASRLHDLASLVEHGELPAGALDGLERALGRAERDAWITIAATHAGGPAGLQRLIADQAWRVMVWLRRGTTPARGDPALVALYNAIEAGGPLPCERQVRRIVNGRGMSDSLG